MQRSGFDGHESCACTPAEMRTRMTAAAKPRRIPFIRPSYIHTKSMRLVSGHEALVTRVLAEGGRTGFCFNLQVDATAPRPMAMYNVGLWPRRPRITPGTGPPGGTRWAAGPPAPLAV